MPPTEPIEHQAAEEAKTEAREFKYYPTDFGKLPVKVEHFNLLFDIFDEHTVIESDMTMTVLEPKLKKLSLDAKNMEIVEVRLYEKVKAKGDHEKNIPAQKLEFHYDKENDKLYIEFPKEKKRGETFTISTKTITRPTKNILEGLYFDETPKGAPPTQITQCQQWGFQRLVPCYDDMTAKCTYTTTIIADARYTNMISNGDVAAEFHDRNGNVQKKRLENNRAKIRYEMHKTPMAPYLFFLGVGTYATVKREFEYPDGKKFMLELLVPPDADKKQANHALDILDHGIMWIHLHTGAGKYDAWETKKKIWELIKKRDALKQRDRESKELAETKKELILLAEPLLLGYQYTGDVYREIGMQNSNFGGMENVGNTTIVTNRIIPFAQISDDSFEFLMEVKAHEFYHNLNGSEVTGIDPFVLWLNEAVTCHIETEYLAHMMGDAYTRISRVMTLHAPMFGTFAEENGPAAMPIVPKGFNTPDELITGMTYVKAPEFVKMIETLMGREKFVKALALYHQRFKHANAATDDWLTTMEEVSGLHFKEMAKGWLTRTGFPRILVETKYDKQKGTYEITITQKGFDIEGPWQFPFVYALLDAKGKEILSEQLHWIKYESETITHHVKEEPAYVSFNRNHALYGTVDWKQQTQQQLELQAQTDSDVVTRYMAFSTLLDQEKVKLVRDIDAEISPVLISLYGKILTNTNLTPEVKALFLAVTESVRDETVNHKYREIYAAKEKIKKTIAAKYKRELLEAYKKYAAEKFTGTYIEQQIAGMKIRDMKNLVLSLLASLETKDVLDIVKQQLQTATCATDKNAAMALYLNSSAADKLMLLESFKKEAEQHLVSWESFLRIVGSNNSEDAIAIMKKIEKDSHFRIEQSNDQRGLYVSFAANRKKSVLTKEGLEYLTEIMIRVSKLNEYTGFHFLAAFSDMERLEMKEQIAMVAALSEVKSALSKKEQPSVVNNIDRTLKGCPKAVKVWKESKK
ncbi:DUF3458 domain-containing protein [Candidatus Woesearchaeota archaeon]|nr:DUF3458 domain-containing protein [Candidatus Woesearchaeota archaeon]